MWIFCDLIEKLLRNSEIIPATRLTEKPFFKTINVIISHLWSVQDELNHLVFRLL